MLNNYEMFTRKALNSIEIAIRTDSAMGHTYVGSEHLIIGFLKEGGNVAAEILKKGGVSYDSACEQLIILVGQGEETSLSSQNITPALRRILNNSAQSAAETKTQLIGTEHILMSMIKEPGCGAVNFLNSFGMNTAAVYSECVKAYNGNIPDEIIRMSRNDFKKLPTLYKYGKNLTEQVWERKIQPAIGRDRETERIIQILARKVKNNPCLIGEAGVGKTAVVEGIAYMLSKGNVPDELKKKTIFSIDLTSMVAGAKYRGDFEERIKSCIDEVIENGDIILFIDEIHSLVGAGAAEGAIDAANILKPQLARGEIQLIGATTIEEYRKYIEKDSALERRFQPVIIEEPSEEATISILNGIRKQYEEFHNVIIPDDVIRSAVSLSVRYINDRFLPDKAIDVIDEAASRVKIRNSNSVRKSFIYPFKLSDEKLSLEKLEKKFSSSQDKKGQPAVMTVEDTASVVSLWTGIPVNKINEKEEKRLINLESELMKRVIGQDEAVASLARAIRRSRIGLREQSRPISSFIFMGSTGVGKTELSKAAAEIIFGSSKSLIKVDMSEFMEKHTVSKITGAPPGYAGYDEKNSLTDTVRRHPYSVILFDEIEKAHPDVLNLLLQILDDGILTDSTGRKINFKNTLIIMTSNIASEIIEGKGALGFGEENREDLDLRVKAELKRFLKPELINRVDEIIIFNRLNSAEPEKIADKLMSELCERAEKIGIELSYGRNVLKALVDERQIEKYGARYIKREIIQKIENLISQKVVDGSISSGSKVRIQFKENEFVLTQPAMNKE